MYASSLRFGYASLKRLYVPTLSRDLLFLYFLATHLLMAATVVYVVRELLRL